MPSPEFRWFQEMSNRLAERYPFRWIAINGAHIEPDWGALDRIIVSSGDSLGEVFEIARRHNLDPMDLFYVFVRPWIEYPERQDGSR